MVKTRLAIILCWALCVLSRTVARAVCVGPSVNSFGAKGDGHTDDTAAIQSAINAAASGGGGSVVFGVGRYFTTGTFVVPQGVVLCGSVEGIGAGVTDLRLHYPNQVASSANAPYVYPYTIVVTQPGTKVARSTVTNAYNFLDIEVGRTMAQDLFIGAFNTGVKLDQVYAPVTLHNLLNQVFWDVLDGTTYPRPTDASVLNHGTALVVDRADNLDVHDFFVFSRFTGILLTDSPDTSQNPTCGYGAGSDIDLDTVQYGIVAIATNTPGFKFSTAISPRLRTELAQFGFDEFLETPHGFRAVRPMPTDVATSYAKH